MGKIRIAVATVALVVVALVGASSEADAGNSLGNSLKAKPAIGQGNSL